MATVTITITDQALSGGLYACEASCKQDPQFNPDGEEQPTNAQMVGALLMGTAHQILSQFGQCITDAPATDEKVM